MLHPSNYGSHTDHLLNFICKMVKMVLQRVHREKSEVRAFLLTKMLKALTEEQIQAFVNLLMPHLDLIIFSKSSKGYAEDLVRTLAHLCPEILIPLILETYSIFCF